MWHLSVFIYYNFRVVNLKTRIDYSQLRINIYRLPSIQSGLEIEAALCLMAYKN